MSTQLRNVNLTSEQVAGHCACSGRSCLVCHRCADWYYDVNAQHWKRRTGATCKISHLDPYVTDDLDAGARQAKNICGC